MYRFRKIRTYFRFTPTTGWPYKFNRVLITYISCPGRLVHIGERAVVEADHTSAIRSWTTTLVYIRMYTLRKFIGQFCGTRLHTNNVFAKLSQLGDARR